MLINNTTEAERAARELAAQSYAAKQALRVTPRNTSVTPSNTNQGVTVKGNTKHGKHKPGYMKAYRSKKRTPKLCPHCQGEL